VVGNITLGGSGKTPVVHSLVTLLRQHGWNTGVLTRGYMSDFESSTLLLGPGETSPKAGDEANMLSELCACPIAVGADRVHSAQQLISAFPNIDLLLADDGLQHYALARDIEIHVQREQTFGNGFCLPAGPLREPRSRLKRVDINIRRDSDEVVQQLKTCWNLQQPGLQRELESFRGKPLYALAAIGQPQGFFSMLQQYGLETEVYDFADHHAFSARDIQRFHDRPLLVTHKDAVKLRSFNMDNIWVVPLELHLTDALQSRIIKLVESKTRG
jgi:tetraacyldisaccharide 4'-kinase